MAVDNALQPERTGVPAGRRRARRRPKSRAVKGAAFEFSLTIGGYPIRVFSAPVLPEEAQSLWHPDDQEIYVLSESSSSVGAVDRLLHEVLHAISTLMLVEEDHLTERQTNTMSTAFVDTLVRNPEFRTRFLAAVSLAATPEVPEAH